MDSISSPLDHINNINPSDLISILREKFKIERLDRFFTIEPYEFRGIKVSIDTNVSLLLKFETLKNQFPEEYKEFSSYHLLLILNLNDKSEDYYNTDLQNDLISITSNDNINHLVIWSLVPLSSGMIRILKDKKTDVLNVSQNEILKTTVISNFVAKSSENLVYWILLNSVAELLLKRLKKLFHLVLSEIAAPIYDKRYKSARAATKSFMNFEEKVLEGIIQRLNSKSRTHLAIDVGCGTGRHSFMAGKFFKKVYGFDMSTNMIIEAKKTLSRIGSQGKLIFSVCDFEYEEIFDEPDWFNKTDLIIASFGMGSFIEDSNKMFKRFYDWLKPGGYILLSFYNTESVMLSITPNWRDTSLSAHIDKNSNTLRVTLSPKTVFHIYCKPFDNNTKSQILGLFEIENILTYPTTMGLMPNGLLENNEAYSLFEYIDLSLSRGSRYNDLGHYVLVVAKKPERPHTSYANIIELLHTNKCKYEILQHNPVHSINDVKKEIGEFPGIMLKTVVFSTTISMERQLVSVTLPSEKKVDKQSLSLVLNVNPNALKFASEKEIINLGFPIGGIAPIGFKSDSKVRNFIDESLINLETEWLYMGVGDNRKTLKINKEDFNKLVASYDRITF
ncbi:MAG: methyltransferase domain-containing protein [Stygiobacter sp.]|nr:MAG: methyltransferase domain-containing protein [Stygiobacter sp.]